MVARHVFDSRHRGAPGIAHGGAVVTVLDDMVGMLLYVVGDMAVTRKLDTKFFAPVLLGAQYEVSADLVSRTGRKLEVRTELREEATRQLVASADGLFVVVTLEHFTSSLRNGSALRVSTCMMSANFVTDQYGPNMLSLQKWTGSSSPADVRSTAATCNCGIAPDR